MPASAPSSDRVDTPISARQPHCRIKNPPGVILIFVSTRQRIRRAALAVVATLCGVLCVFAAAALTWSIVPIDKTVLLVALWVSGLAGFGLSIAACRVEDDSLEDPHYFSSIVRGIRSEWHHDDAA
jgi:hypothetical protein